LSVTPPKISVCIPAYNRSKELGALLDTIVKQEFKDFEIVICEDCSPERVSIRALVTDYSARYGNLINYKENKFNLGYDGNLRNLVAQAHGEYCFFMGNDDLMCPRSLVIVAEALGHHPDIGVILRSYASFDETSDKINQVFRYFDSERFFPAGPATAITFFRRSVVISGLVVHRQTARKYSTEKFDGSLLYQLHLVANILLEKNGAYLPEPLILYRNGGVPDFGNSLAEKGKFTPTRQTPESSIHFVRGMLDIAKQVEKDSNVLVYDSILKDMANYSYPFLQIQARRPTPMFLRYVWSLAKLGFWKNRFFYAYVVALLIFGPSRVDAMIRFIKRRRKATPVFGDVYEGQKI
jgi:abequosyltransferase